MLLQLSKTHFKAWHVLSCTASFGADNRIIVWNVYIVPDIHQENISVKCIRPLIGFTGVNDWETVLTCTLNQCFEQNINVLLMKF